MFHKTPLKVGRTLYGGTFRFNIAMWIWIPKSNTTGNVLHAWPFTSYMTNQWWPIYLQTKFWNILLNYLFRREHLISASHKNGPIYLHTKLWNSASIMISRERDVLQNSPSQNWLIYLYTKIWNTTCLLTWCMKNTPLLILPRIPFSHSWTLSWKVPL